MECRAVRKGPRAASVGDVGEDSVAPVSPDYGARGNAFNGTVKGVQLAIAEGAEEADHLVSPEEQSALPWRGSKLFQHRRSRRGGSSFTLIEPHSTGGCN